jgi:hypothetical protein
MNAKQFFSSLGIFTMTLAITACPPKPNKKPEIRKGSGRPSLGQGTVGAGTPRTGWGYITGSDGNFQAAVTAFTYPAVSEVPDESVGQVSPQAGQNGGIFFYGDVGLGQNGQVSGGAIQIEVYDSKYGQPKPNGGTYQAFVIQVGGAQGNSTQMTFTSESQTVFMQGNIQGDQFVGTLSFSNAATLGQWQTLGQFTVPRCSFFRCQ